MTHSQMFDTSQFEFEHQVAEGLSGTAVTRRLRLCLFYGWLPWSPTTGQGVCLFQVLRTTKWRQTGNSW